MCADVAISLNSIYKTSTSKTASMLMVSLSTSSVMWLLIGRSSIRKRSSGFGTLLSQTVCFGLRRDTLSRVISGLRSAPAETISLSPRSEVKGWPLQETKADADMGVVEHPAPAHTYAGVEAVILPGTNDDDADSGKLEKPEPTRSYAVDLFLEDETFGEQYNNRIFGTGAVRSGTCIH
jgi:hypothetical protein